MKIRASLVVVFSLLFSSPIFAVPEGPALPPVATYKELVQAIRQTRNATRERIEQAVQQEKVREAWETGKLIDQHVLLNKKRANYGQFVVLRLSKDLAIEKAELYYMLQFARTYPIVTPARQLSWSQYRELLSINNDNDREKLASLAEKNNWNRNDLRKAIRKYQSEHKPRATSSEAETLSQDAEPTDKPLTAKPGKLHAYRVVKGGPLYKGEPVLDLGFSNYYQLPKKLDIKEGDILQLKESIQAVGKPVVKTREHNAIRKKAMAKYDSVTRKYHSKITRSTTQYSSSQTFVKLQGAGADESLLFTYNAYIFEVIDGDSIKALIDLGFGFSTFQTLRLRGIDAPEIESREGKEAKAFLEKEILNKTGAPIVIRTVKSDKYDRYLADLFVGGRYVNRDLADAGLATVVEA
ncbi:MAG: thermonuclease family protein [Candidatus Omnitrophica bacterium]|nr:thermonuclease family protein [Candidatus Omnitrophota bacterium]